MIVLARGDRVNDSPHWASTASIQRDGTTSSASRRIVPLFVLSFILFCPTRGAAQVFMGRVVDAVTGEGIPHARIAADASGERPIASMQAGGSGRFRLSLPPGTYRLRVSRTGYEAEVSEPVVLAAGDTARLTLRMRPSAVPIEGITVVRRPVRMLIEGIFSPADSAGALAPLLVEPERRSVSLRGVLHAPSGCLQVAATAFREGFVLTVIVAARPDGSVCQDTPADFRYDLTVHRVAPGSYPLRVIHSIPGIPDAVVLDTAVVVP